MTTEQQLKKIEEKLERLEVLSNENKISRADFLSFRNDEPEDEEIDLHEIWRNVIWAGRLKIIAITSIFVVFSVIYSLYLPNIYESEIVLAPAQSEGKGGLGGLASQYGGLAAMAGIELGGADGDRMGQAITLLQSWPFLKSFVDKYNLKPQIMAVDKWNKEANVLELDTSIYSPNQDVWLDGEEPTSYETYLQLSKLIDISFASKDNLFTISAKHYSPHIAKQWVELLALEINQHFQSLDIADATRNINYLSRKISETNISEMQDVFYSMIESQTKTLMLAEDSEQYLLKTVVPAMVAEQKSEPKRALIVIIASLFGLAFSVFYLLITSFKKPV